MITSGNKILALTLVMVGIVTLVVLLKLGKSNTSEDNSWHTIEMGTLKFNSPEPLESIPSGMVITAAIEMHNVHLFSDQSTSAVTYCFQGEIISDSVSIVDAYSAILEPLLSKHGISPAQLKMDDIEVDETEMSATYLSILNDEPSLGFGYIKQNGNKVESLWLVPVTKGFTPDYIMRFKKGIYGPVTK